jgi:hypothetical protein
MTTIAVVAGGLVAVAAYSYISTPSDVKKPDNQFQEQTPSNPAGYPPALTSPSTTGGPTAPTPAAPSIPSIIVPLPPKPAVPPATSVPAPIPVVPAAAPSISAVPVKMACGKNLGSGDTFYREDGTSTLDASGCAAKDAQEAAAWAASGSTGSRPYYKMVPADSLKECTIL